MANEKKREWRGAANTHDTEQAERSKKSGVAPRTGDDADDKDSRYIITECD